MSVSPRMCERGHGNDGAGEGLEFKNNHLGRRMGSWPHQLSWIPILPQLGCAGVPLWAVPTWEWTWGKDSTAAWQWSWSLLGLDACMPPALKLAVPRVEAGTGWVLQWGTWGEASSLSRCAEAGTDPTLARITWSVGPGATGTFFQEELGGTGGEAVGLSPESGVSHRLTLKGLSLSATACLGTSC